MRTIWSNVLKTTLTLGAIVYLVVVVEPSAVATAFAEVRWPAVAAAALLRPLSLGLEVRMWRGLLRPVAPHVASRRLWRAVLSGFALAFVTPARVGEFAGRALSLPGADPWAVGLTVFVQRVVDTTVNVLAGTGALVVLLATGALDASAAWWTLAGVGGGVGVLLLGGLTCPRGVAGLVDRLLPHRTSVRGRVALLRAYTPREIARALGWAVLRYGVFCTQFLLLLYAFAPDLPLGSAVLAVTLTFFVKFLAPSITLMDLGIQEGAAVFFLGLFGVAQAVAFNAALVLFLITIVVPTAAGVPFVWRLRFARADAPSPTRS